MSTTNTKIHAGWDVARSNKVPVKHEGTSVLDDKSATGSQTGREHIQSKKLPIKHGLTSVLDAPSTGQQPFKDEQASTRPVKQPAISHPVRSHKSLRNLTGLCRIINPQVYSQYGAVEMQYQSFIPNSNTFYSTRTGKTYHINNDITVESKYVCYLITLLNTGEQYVGETKRRLRTRANEHFTKNISKDACSPLAIAFKKNLKGLHPLLNIIIQPIDQGNNKKDIIKKEEFWIRELRTLYPYGLNIRMGFRNWDQAGCPSGLCFNSQKKKRAKTRKPFRYRMDRKHSPLTFSEYITKVHNTVNPSECPTTVSTAEYKQINALTHSIPVQNITAYLIALKQCSVKEGRALHGLTSFNKRLFILVEDMLLTRLIHIKNHNNKKVNPNDTAMHQKPKDKEPKRFWVVHYVNKLMAKIGLRKILQDQAVLKFLPDVAKNYIKTLHISWEYDDPLSLKLYNYNPTIRGLTWNDSMDNKHCLCHLNKYRNFVDGHHKHVLTTDLSIIHNKDLRYLMSRGVKFRQPKSSILSVAIEEVKNKLEVLGKKLQSINEQHNLDLKPWKDAILGKINEKANSLSKWASRYNNINKSILDLLDKPATLKYIKFMKKHFVFAPVDKAGCMFSIICKSFYIKVIKEELQITKGTQPVYVPTDRTEQDIIDEHTCSNEDLNIDLEESDKKLPTLYWIPKFHKTPVGFRFISGSSSCTTQQASKKLTIILKSLDSTVQRMAADYRSSHKVNTYWVITNTRKVLNKIKVINDFSKASSVSTYDFERLYTNIPLDLLYQRMRQLLMECSKYQKAKRLILNKHNGRWSANNSGLSIPELLHHLKFVLDNTYVKVGDHIYKQVIGIPMGTNCAPYLANLFLYTYEKQYITENLAHINKTHYNATFRYIDDLLVCNNPNFDAIKYDIYPSQFLNLKQTDVVSDSKVHYMDLTIETCSGRFITSTFDKRDDFGFEIINYPFLEGNYPEIPLHGVFTSQLSRFRNNASSISDFEKWTKRLYNKLLLQNFKRRVLEQKFVQFMTVQNKFTLMSHINPSRLLYTNDWCKYTMFCCRSCYSVQI